MKLLLDTCTFLWVASGSHRLSKTAATLFLNPENERYLSAASAWEIGIKQALGRLPLPAKPTTYIAKIRQASGIEPLSVDEEAMLYGPVCRASTPTRSTACGWPKRYSME